MCQFFSFVTDPVNHPAEYYYFDWEYRKGNLDDDGVDSHSHICAHFKLDEDRCNKYEFNPLTKAFVIDQINAERDDSKAAEKWARRLNFKEVIEPLIIKPIVNPLELPKAKKPTNEQIGWLKEWASVGELVGDPVGDSVSDPVGDSVRASAWESVGESVVDSAWESVGESVVDPVWESVRASVGESVGESVRALVWAYVSSFFDVEYKFDFSSAVKLWESGLVPSFDGTIWRLHSGKNAYIVFEWTPEVQQ
jgi:hypothetical protein